MSNSKVIKEFDYQQTVNGIPVLLRELIWSDGGRSWEVFRLGKEEGKEDEELTIDSCFDQRPSEEMIAFLLAPSPRWTCPGCGKSYDNPGSDVVDHVNNCEWVDGGGQRKYGQAWA